MRRAVAIAALCVGCASAPVKLTFTPGVPGEPGLIAGSEPATPQLASVEIDPKFYGRGCFSAEVKPNGSVVVAVSSDATSDWAGVRSLPAILPQIVTAAVSVVGAPWRIVEGLLGIDQPEMQPPSQVGGCDALFED